MLVFEVQCLWGNYSWSKYSQTPMKILELRGPVPRGRDAERGVLHPLQDGLAPMLYYIILYYIILYYIRLDYIISYHIILYYVILCYIILYYSILYYITYIYIYICIVYYIV